MIIWLIQSLRFIDLIVNRGLNITTFLYFSSMMMPSLLWLILPISLFISVMITYNKLTTDSELVVLISSGISRFGIMKPAIYLGLFVTMLSYVFSLYLLPASYREFKDTQAFIRDNYVSVLLQEGVFTSPTNNIMVYIRERANNGLLYGIMVHDKRDPSKPITMIAQEGQFIQTPAGPRFILLNGNRQEIQQETGQLSLLYFERYALDLNNLITKTDPNRWREPQERYLDELLHPEQANPHLHDKLRAEAHHRLTWPLYNLLVAILALFPFILGEFNRRAQWKRLIVISLLGIGSILLGISMNNIVAKNITLVPAMYAVILTSITISWYILIHFRRLRDIPILKHLILSLNSKRAQT